MMISFVIFLSEKLAYIIATLLLLFEKKRLCMYVFMHVCKYFVIISSEFYGYKNIKIY